MITARFLVFETGGTKLVAALADGEARLLETRVLRRNPEDRAEQSFARLLEEARSLAAGAALEGVGFGYGGAVDRVARRPMICLHEAGWEDLDPVRTLEQELGVPASIENDCKLAALAEARLGAGRVAQTVFYVTIGTGIGGGLVHDGSIVALSPLGEGEIGHLIVDPEGPECDCGNRGCLEALCAGPNLPRLAPGVARDSQELFALAGDGDARAAAAVARAADYLAMAFAAAANLFCPDVFVVGGGIGSSYPAFLAEIEEKTRRGTVPYFRDRVRVRPCELKEQVVAQGAALLAAAASGRG